MSEENFIRFLLEHEGDDPARLLLSADRWPGIDVRRAARLIEARRKIREKLPSWHALPEIDYPDSIALEQCSSEEAARYGTKLVRVLDGQLESVEELDENGNTVSSVVGYAPDGFGQPARGSRRAG